MNLLHIVLVSERHYDFGTIRFMLFFSRIFFPLNINNSLQNQFFPKKFFFNSFSYEKVQNKKKAKIFG